MDFSCFYGAEEVLKKSWILILSFDWEPCTVIMSVCSVDSFGVWCNLILSVNYVYMCQWWGTNTYSGCLEKQARARDYTWKLSSVCDCLQLCNLYRVGIQCRCRIEHFMRHNICVTCRKWKLLYVFFHTFSCTHYLLSKSEIKTKFFRGHTATSVTF